MKGNTSLGFLLGWFAAWVVVMIVGYVNDKGRGLSPHQIEQATDLAEQVVEERCK